MDARPTPPRPVDHERELLNRVIAGDDHAATELLARFQKLVRFVLRQMDVAEPDLNDVAQETWANAWRQLSAGQFRGDCAFGSWLKKVVQGTVIDYRRRCMSRRLSETVALDALDPSARPEMTVHADQATLLLVEEAIASLTPPPRLRVVFELRFRSGWDVADIARVLHLSTQRTYALIDEARRRFAAAVLDDEKNRASKRLREKADG